MRETQSIKTLRLAIDEYLGWMATVGYSPRTQQVYRRQLGQWLDFVKSRNLPFDKIFTAEIFAAFKKTRTLNYPYGVSGLSYYLFAQNKIPAPLRRKPWHLTAPYADYVDYYRQTHAVSHQYLDSIRRILDRLDQWLQKEQTALADVTITQIDAFLVQFNANLGLATRRVYRSCLRGFLRYLYYQKGILKKDLAPLVVGPALFAPQKPPKFLRPSQVRRLFDAACVDTPTDLRTLAMLHLAAGLGLRPQEICRIKLDDVHFTAGELTLSERKNDQPIRLPVTEETLKAIAAYLIGGRPECAHRMLFANHSTPHGPITRNTVSRCLGQLMRKAGLKATAYWLRHTYAQNLLESGASIYEIKEMMGHDRIQSSQRYLHIHTRLMRKVIVDEKL